MMIKSLWLVAVAVAWSIGSAAFAADQPAASQPTDVKVYQKNYAGWVYRCVAAQKPGQKPIKTCQVSQRVVLKENGRLVPLFVLFFSRDEKNGGYDSSAIVPVGIMLPPGILLSADKDTPIARAVDFCLPNACVIESQSSDNLVQQFKSGTEGRIQMTARNGQPIVINFPLKGFTDAITALDSGRFPPEIKPASAG